MAWSSSVWKKNGVSTFRYRLIKFKVPEKASLGFDECLKRGQGKEKGKVTSYYRGLKGVKNTRSKLLTNQYLHNRISIFKIMVSLYNIIIIIPKEVIIVINNQHLRNFFIKLSFLRFRFKKWESCTTNFIQLIRTNDIGGELRLKQKVMWY